MDPSPIIWFFAAELNWLVVGVEFAAVEQEEEFVPFLVAQCPIDGQQPLGMTVEVQLFC